MVSAGTTPGRSRVQSAECAMPPANSGLRLTVDERPALGLAAAGLGAPEVAGVKPAPADSVREWLASAPRKLRARSRLEAVLIGLKPGELDALCSLPAQAVRAQGPGVSMSREDGLA